MDAEFHIVTPHSGYTSRMDAKHTTTVSGVEFVVDNRGRKTAVLINLKQHGALWEDMFDALLVEKRRSEPRESLSAVKRQLARRISAKGRA